MDRYQMNRMGCRPYNRTCGMARPTAEPSCTAENSIPVQPRQMQQRMENHGNCRMEKRESCREERRMEQRQERDCTRRMPDTCTGEENMYTHLKHLPVAMAYVPFQRFNDTFNLCTALNTGTIFPDLCKPFCGRRGCCR